MKEKKMNMEKIYCENCKYVLEYKDKYYNNKFSCKHHTNLKYIDTPLKKIQYHEHDISILNKKNKCKNFEKKAGFIKNKN